MSSEYAELGTTDWSERFRAIISGLMLVVAGLGAGVVIQSFVTHLLQLVGIQSPGTSTMYLIGTISQGIGFGAAVAWFVLISEHDDLIALRWPTRRDLGCIVVGIVTLLLAAKGAEIVYSQFDIGIAQHQIQQIGAENPEVLLYLIVLSFLVIGPGEELLFRGAVQSGLRRVYAPLPGILIASVLFSVPHIIAVVGSTNAAFAYLAIVFALGSILGSVYEITDNLLVPILVHGAYDAVTFFTIYLQVT